MQIFLGGGSFSAQQAAEWGLLNMVVPADDLQRETSAWAARLAKTSSQAISATKRLIHQSSSVGMEEQLEAEADALCACMRTPTFSEAVRSFTDLSQKAPAIT